MSWFDTPTPPNPLTTAAASTSTNVNTAVANAYLNNTNQVTPDGSLNYNQTGQYGWTDPTTGSSYQIPTFTATQTLSPQGQAIKSQSDAAKYNLAGIANAESAKVSGILASPFNPNSSPFAGGDPNTISNLPSAAVGFDAGGPIQQQLADAGNITRTYGPADNFSADRQRYEDSLMQRMNPQLAIEKQGITQSLADQGIRYGSQAYASAMDDYNRQANDARFAAIGQAGQEQQRMTQEAGAQAAFQNQAQDQAYQQALGGGTFANQAQQQGFNQNATQAGFYNAGLAQQASMAQSGFNAQQAARNQWMQEQYASRNQPLNEISALMSGSQVSQPNWLNTPSSQIPTTDIGGLINQNFNQQMQVNQQQSQNANQLIGGVLGLGAGALKLSDEREKKNIDRVGTVFAFNEDAEREKLPIYAYEYKNDPSGARHTGPMAQEVERIDPKAVKNIDGRKYLDERQVMGNILRAA